MSDTSLVLRHFTHSDATPLMIALVIAIFVVTYALITVPNASTVSPPRLLVLHDPVLLVGSLVQVGVTRLSAFSTDDAAVFVVAGTLAPTQATASTAVGARAVPSEFFPAVYLAPC